MLEMSPAEPEEDELILILQALEAMRSIVDRGKGADKVSNAALDAITDHVDNIEAVIRSLSETQLFGPDELEIRHVNFTKRLKRLRESEEDRPQDAT